jgi:hypothetical protein
MGSINYEQIKARLPKGQNVGGGMLLAWKPKENLACIYKAKPKA